MPYALVVQETSAQALLFAQEHSLEVAVAGGCHTDSSSTEGGLLVDFSKMRQVTVDAEEMAIKALREARYAKMLIMLLRNMVRHSGGVDSLIPYANIINPVGPLPTLAVEDWKRTFDVNFFAALYMGNIMITSARVCLKPSESWVCQASAKTLLNYLCSCILLGDSRIQSIIVTPYAVDTVTNAAMQNVNNLPLGNGAFMKDLHEEGKLLKSELPASTFVKLVEEGIPDVMTGQTVTWDFIVTE
ncbi:hypothetical protein GGI35DRAFT_484939 [Trichoderma velutinum]